jgi:glycosyltransferase involved in cell wall biosynthesis
MAAGLPIVTTPAGAAVDLLSHAHNAMIVPFSDTTALVGAVNLVLGDSRLRERIGRAAQTTAMSYTCQSANVQFLTRLLAVVSWKSPAGAATLVGDDVVS